ncbi:FtsK/SpoIIIE domain-containing protein [Glaciibacter psychrotolerans]|uniref:S-DNA-T family DNA segregation ATPase FtsK/SpoIIIE n=1 Tax=Glaciibacter psychrotolerans TaxID=670054 RepID=A0A7Z0J6W0_9MICO|nr:FtsK/SpoIIIE domain-containing protein [Leifsonia psychrotolerans]NYJ20962.1 S-DNA-T family DNA segregation ATPase FtsK/SpoIIIE [Leifsonia psychrotolerans]
MSLRLTVQNPASPADTQSWLLKIDESTTISEVADTLELHPAAILAGSNGNERLVDSGIVSGAVVPSSENRELAAGQTRLEFVGGPFAGEQIALDIGRPLTIGRAHGADICVADPFLNARHVTVVLSGGIDPDTGRAIPLTATFTPADSASGAPADVSAATALTVNGEPIVGVVQVVPADIVQIGSSIVRIGVAPPADADVARSEPGNRAFNRPSRIRSAAVTPIVSLPGDKPQELDSSPLPWLSAIIPIILGVTMAVLFQRPVMLLMAAASPIMVVGSFLTNKKLAKRKGQRTEADWIDEINHARTRIIELVREQRLDQWYRQLDPLVIRDIATRPLSRLWERRRGDDDALQLRVGTADVPLEVAFEGGAAKDRSQPRRAGVSPAPVGIDLVAGPAGIAGPADVAQGLVRAMLCSLATLRSPRDLQLMVLCDKEQSEEWAWTQWLPHTQFGENVVALIGNTDLTRRERLREAGTLLESRMRAAGTRALTYDQHLVIVIDGARRYRMLPGMVAILERGAAYGIHVIAIDSDRSRLPEECVTVVTADAADPTLGRIESASVYHSTVLLDSVTTRYAETVARALCPIDHVSGVGDDATLPGSVRFTELLGIDLDDVRPIVEQWAVAPRQSYVVVGAGSDGEFAIDIASDGPHALVAGTTGSGKSEFLQTFVVSLALANRPDALNFVLIDYKGGAAFADCARLPHTVGTVTNLDARETERALASLDAELKRRERVLRDEIGAKDVDAAWAKDPDAAARLGLARLMIVVDEFAELKTELPDFITGLVRIARVGRSLGVNLVLATQRPSGVVTPEMQSNLNLRIALRVTDRADSGDVIGTPDAALISSSNPGRGFVRVGLDAAPMPFQTARVANLRAGHQRVARVLPPRAALDWNTTGLPPRYPSAANAPTHRPDQDDTDLRALVGLIAAAAAHAGIPRSPSPWLMPLPDVLTLDRFDADAAPDGALLIGLEDVPAAQTQRPLTWSVHDDSHLLFFGGALSGRTTVLRTMLAQAVQRFTPADLHLYIADYGTGALLALADAPHTGAVVTPLDQGRMPRLVSTLVAELRRRQAVLSQAGVGSIGEQRRNADPREALPYALFVVDGWERLSSSLSADEMVVIREQVMRLLREGAAAGIRVVVTADRSVSADKISAFIDTHYALRMRDVNDYRAAGIMIRELAPEMPAGRVLFGSDGTEAQIAVLSADTSGEAQNAIVRGVVEHVSAHFASFPQLAELPRPVRVDPLPTSFALSESFALPVLVAGMPEHPVVGIGGDTLSRVTLDWPTAGGFVVVGDPRTGKSSTLALIAHQLAWSSAPVVVVATGDSALTEVAASHGVPVLNASSTADTIAAALEPRDTTLTIIVDDAEHWRDSALERALTAAKGHSVYCVSIGAGAASSIFSGPYSEAKKALHGLLLSPGTTILGTQVFGGQIPRYLVGRRPAGGGALYIQGEYLPVQVPDLRR